MAAVENRSRFEGPPCSVHVDLDGAKHIFRVHGWRYEAERDFLFESGLRSALELFEELDIQATLFVIAEDLEDPFKLRLLREAVVFGHDFASHTATHRLLTRLTSNEQRKEVHASRLQLADTLGVAVDGFRAPAFDIDASVLRTVAEAGYAWDSSLFASASPSRGIPPVQSGPARLGFAPPLVELPLPDHFPLPLPFHPSYAFVLGPWYFRLGLRRFRRTRNPLVLLFHLTEFSDPLDSRHLPSLRARGFTLSHLSKARKLSWCRALLDHVQHQYRVVSTHSFWTDLVLSPGE